MDLALAERRVLVAGASRGLGKAIAEAMAAEGAEVVAVARNRERLEALAAASAGTITARACDLTQAADIENLADVLARVDVLVLNSGGPPPGSAAATSDALWQSQFEAMFLSVIRLTRLALPGMRQRGFGRIIAVVSSGVVQPLPNLAISNALRSALVGWAKTLATEVGGDGVTVNCIAPGRIATDRLAELDANRASREGIDIAEVARQSRGTIPVGRYGDPAEFAAMATFLASTRAAYMTGGVIRVDGGMIKSL